MKRQRLLWQRLADSVDLPGESLPGIPVVEIAGRGRVLIENHLGVCEYGDCQICVKVKNGQICIQGCRLKLSQMSSAQIVISGRVDSVNFCEKGR